MTHLTRTNRRAVDRDPVPGWRERVAYAAALLRELFPAPARGQEGPLRRRLLVAGGYLAALAAGALLLLERVPGSAWAGIYQDDYNTYLVQSLEHPWSHLLTPHNGYLTIPEQLIGQFAAMLPLPDAALFFAVTGAVIASACALFVFAASAGHIRSPWLRGLLGLAVLLLPVAPMEIADTGVDTCWYLMFALFWAILWRPRTRTGIALAALAGFVAVIANALAIVFAPLLLLRVIALPRLREHGVTIGWAIGALVQAPWVYHTLVDGHSRVSKLATPGQSAAFYGHEVVLPSLGWHLSWWLRDHVGVNTGTLVVGCVLAVVFGWALVTQPPSSRLFILVALIGGFVLTIAAVTATWQATVLPVTPAAEHGSRYTVVPILLLDAAAIVAVDYRIRGIGGGGLRVRAARGGANAVVAVAALVAVLAFGWIADYRYAGLRADTPAWAPVAASWLRACDGDPGKVLRVQAQPGIISRIPCAAIRR